MKRCANFFAILLLFNSCSKEDLNPMDYSSIPHIEFISYEFKEIEDFLIDSLTVSIKISDREMDLGLNYRENFFPRHLFEYIIDSDGDKVMFRAKDVVLPMYALTPMFDQKYDTVFYSNSIDEIPKTYNCRDFLIETYTYAMGDSLVVRTDTILIRRNDHYFNLFLKIETADSPAGYDDFWSDCRPPYHGRFPVFPEKVNKVFRYEGSPYKLHRLNEFEGILTYHIASAIRLFYRTDKIRLGCFVNDNELNISNEIISEFINIQ